MPAELADVAALLGAVVLAAAGGEAFLKAIVAAAKHLRVPSAVVATTLAAFATSGPELSVSTVAALSGHPEIGLGDALGSNVVNIALIFGLALLYGPVVSARNEFGRDYLLALAVPFITALMVLDGSIARWEGFVLLAFFAGWIGWVLRATLRRRATPMLAAVAPSVGLWATLVFGAAGLAALIAAGRLFVLGATGIAASFAIDAYVIGVLVVAVGTSLPELVTMLLSRLRGHEEVGIGTLIGSNLFNGLAIVGTAASIHPIVAPANEVAVTLFCGIAALLLLLPNRAGLVARGRGMLLLALYAAFIWASLEVGA